MTVTEFLEARIAEDEAAAKGATGARWTVLAGVNASLVNIDAALVRDEKWKYGSFGHVATTSHDAAYAEHIARWDPARVLAECAAKRAIIGLHAAFGRSNEPGAGAAWGALGAALQDLAAVYSDHPDYDKDWAL